MLSFLTAVFAEKLPREQRTSETQHGYGRPVKRQPTRTRVETSVVFDKFQKVISEIQGGPKRAHV